MKTFFYVVRALLCGPPLCPGCGQSTRLEVWRDDTGRCMDCLIAFLIDNGFAR